MKGANVSGSNAELIIGNILDILQKKGYSPVRQYTFESNELKEQPIFSNKIRVDFFVRGIPNYESGIVFSSKRQTKGGSVIEKLYHEVIHIIKKCLPCPTILIVTGNHISDKIKAWLIKETDKKRLLNVFFTHDDLLQWVENVPEMKKHNNGIYKNLPLFDLAEYNHK